MPLIVEIKDIALPDAWGVAQHEGQVYFVPGGVPGDRAEISLVQAAKRFNHARLDRLLAASRFRVKPECPHFGTCGGCALQNVAYGEQLAIKGRHLLHTLRTIGGQELSSLDFAGVLASPRTTGVRNKMEFRFGEHQSRTVLGLRPRIQPGAKPGEVVVPLDACPACAAEVAETFAPILEFCRRHNLRPWNAVQRRGQLRHLVLRASLATGMVQATLITAPGSLPDLAPLAEAWLAQAPGATSFWHATCDRPDDVITYDRPKLVAGAPTLVEKLSGLSFDILPHTFFQTNTEAAALLYEQAARLAGLGSGDRVAGLYCGAGALELVLARQAGAVLGIDQDPANIQAATRGAEHNRIANARFQAARVEDLATARQRGCYDLAVVDPPRAGLSPGALEAITDLCAPRLLYISCHPATLARDAKALTASGYRLARLAAVDMFPQTAHLEAAALFLK